MPAKGKIKIAFVNAQKIYKEGLQVLLKKYRTIIIVGETQTDEKLLKFICQKKPDIILVDVCKPDSGCVAGILNTMKYYPDTKVIILLNPDDEGVIFDFLQAGVQGFVVKNDDNEIRKAIEEVHKGNNYYSKAVLLEVEEMLSQTIASTLNTLKQQLTEKEEEIVCYICEEMTNKEISKQLYMSVRTLEGYRLKILQKINAKSTAGIVIYAIQNGIVNIDKKTKVPVFRSKLTKQKKL